jgi:hypothetical protein
MKPLQTAALQQVHGGKFWEKLFDFIHDYGKMQLQGYSYQLHLFKRKRKVCLS